VVLYRIAHWLHARGARRLARLPYYVLRVATGATIPPTCEIGNGTTLAYGGNGVVLHPRATIGRDCLISPGVIVGGRSGKHDVRACTGAWRYRDWV
jgi:serine O-acetyltransferase